MVCPNRMHGFLFSGGGGGTVQFDAFGNVSPPTQSLDGDVYASFPVPLGFPAHSSHDLQFCAAKQAQRRGVDESGANDSDQIHAP